MTTKPTEASQGQPKPVTPEMLNGWVDSPDGPVALHLREKLLPVEGHDAVFFPPTYAGEGKNKNKGGYNIDTFPDGTSIATIDSVGSQANRLEPIFKADDYKELVPQFEIDVAGQKMFLFDVGHRVGDALIKSTDMADKVEEAFKAYNKGDAAPLARIAPTSLVFGAWDSRGTQAKLPRIVQSVVRARNVDQVTRSAQYIPPPYPEKVLEDFTSKQKSELGFGHVPSSVPGGIIAHGPIYRDVTLNLVALRGIRGKDEAETTHLRRYVLGLSMVAATYPMDGFLRQGCLLSLDPAHPAVWGLVNRDGSRQTLAIDHEAMLKHAREGKAAFFPKGVEGIVAKFSTSKAKALVAKASGSTARQTATAEQEITASPDGA